MATIALNVISDITIVGDSATAFPTISYYHHAFTEAGNLVEFSGGSASAKLGLTYAPGTISAITISLNVAGDEFSTETLLAEIFNAAGSVIGSQNMVDSEVVPSAGQVYSKTISGLNVPLTSQPMSIRLSATPGGYLDMNDLALSATYAAPASGGGGSVIGSSIIKPA